MWIVTFCIEDVNSLLQPNQTENKGRDEKRREDKTKPESKKNRTKQSKTKRHQLEATLKRSHCSSK